MTEDRQFYNRGLSHIEDGVYEFFLEAAVLRVAILNDQKFAVHGENLMSYAEVTMKKDASLKEKWLACFPQEEKKSKLVRASFNFF